MKTNIKSQRGEKAANPQLRTSARKLKQPAMPKPAPTGSSDTAKLSAMTVRVVAIWILGISVVCCKDLKSCQADHGARLRALVQMTRFREVAM